MVVEDVVSKKELRQIVINKRKNIQRKKEKEKIIISKLLNNKIIKESKNILIYKAMPDEVDTNLLIKKLFKINKNIYVPKTFNNYIKFYKIEKNTKYIKGRYNILEPISNQELNKLNSSVIIVPGLLFDKFGNRLGYGGGYYDRFLQDKDIYKIGICFSDLLVCKLETEEHDIKMDLIITD